MEEIGGLVKFCATGYEALAKAEAFKPDLFLLDIMMAELDRPTTLKELRKLPTINNVPAIFMTTKIQGGEMAHYKKLGIVDIIAKPFDPVMLSETIRKFWLGYHGK